jgi:hypothetical protein
MGSKRIGSLGWLMLGLALASQVQAGTLQEDEARIEELLRAERAAIVPVTTQVSGSALAAASTTPVIAEVVATVAKPSATDEWLAPAVEQAGLPFGELTHYVGQRVRITTTGEREHLGTVASANARQVTLQVRRAGGNATYTLRRDQVQRVDLR